MQEEKRERAKSNGQMRNPLLPYSTYRTCSTVKFLSLYRYEELAYRMAPQRWGRAHPTQHSTKTFTHDAVYYHTATLQ